MIKVSIVTEGLWTLTLRLGETLLSFVRTAVLWVHKIYCLVYNTLLNLFFYFVQQLGVLFFKALVPAVRNLIRFVLLPAVNIWRRNITRLSYALRLFPPTEDRIVEQQLAKYRNVVCLPSEDPAPEARAFEISNMKLLYKWAHEGIGDASLIIGLPLTEHPDPVWILKTLATADEVAINTLMIPTTAYEFILLFYSRLAKILPAIRFVLATPNNSNRMDEIENYLRPGMSRSLVPSPRLEIPSCMESPFEQFKNLFQSIPLPQIAKHEMFLRDDIFGWYRVAGPNPMSIKLYKRSGAEDQPEGLDADIDDLKKVLNTINGFESDNVENMIKEKRLYYVDYSEFENIPPGTIYEDGLGGLLLKPKTKLSHLYAPRALFGVRESDKNDAVKRPWPLAIRAGQDRNKFPLFNPRSNRLTWIAAKFTVQVADAFAHDLFYHLGQTHLLLEIFICATHRTLHKRHPIYALLVPHFNGTCFINWSAVRFLVQNGGFVDSVTSPDMEKVRDMAGKHIRNFKFNENMLEKDLEKRGFSDSNAITFPYRDDAQQLWRAIHKFVKTYLSGYYYDDPGTSAEESLHEKLETSESEPPAEDQRAQVLEHASGAKKTSANEKVRNDKELAAWAAEITNKDQGALLDFGENDEGEILTVEYLAKAVTMVIFSASVQHAAVNFPQGTMMTYTPAIAPGGYDAPPTSEEIYQSMDELVSSMMPPLNESLSQMQVSYTLGAVHYTRLGDYGDHFKYVQNNSVLSGLRTFKDDLKAIEHDITLRNVNLEVAKLPKYSYCLPQKIPQSINI